MENEKTNNSETFIIKQIKETVKGRRQKVGLFLGTVVKGVIVTGWSKVNLKMGDKYDKKRGCEIALSRANGTMPTPPLPPQLKKEYRNFQIRCLRYFKQAKMLSIEGSFSSAEDILNGSPLLD